VSAATGWSIWRQWVEFEYLMPMAGVSGDNGFNIWSQWVKYPAGMDGVP